MARTQQQYFADIQAVLRRFHQTDDELVLVNQFSVSVPRKCEMCGGTVDIRNCYELENRRSKQRILCGRNCIVKYAIVLGRMNQAPRIVFPSHFREQAEKVNRIRPNTVIVAPPGDYAFVFDEEYEKDESIREEYAEMGLDRNDPDFGELAAEGLDPEDIDWESCDYE